MLVAELLGLTEVKGIDKGIVLINNEPLEASYEELRAVCGNTPVDELDTSVNTVRTRERLQADYLRMVQRHDDTLGEEFVINNRLTETVSYSTYEIDAANASIRLKIEI